jgi:HAE1 family hydrophobic/amphiphilic exporter-1
MARFFINRPIVAMVISILMVIFGVVAIVQLPIALYPNIAPPEILRTIIRAVGVTLEQSATPIEQQMSSVDNMLYMYSLGVSAGNELAARGLRRHATRASTVCNLRYSQAASQLPPTW